MRAAIGAVVIGAGVLLAAPVRAEGPAEPQAADILDWLDRTLAAGAEASAPSAPAPPPALGEGLLGRLLGGAAEESPAAPVSAVPVARSVAAAPPVAPISAPGGAPLALVRETAPQGSAQAPGGLLLPLN